MAGQDGSDTILAGKDVELWLPWPFKSWDILPLRAARSLVGRVCGTDVEALLNVRILGRLDSKVPVDRSGELSTLSSLSLERLRGRLCTGGLTIGLPSSDAE